MSAEKSSVVSAPKMMTFHLPEDEKFLAATGRVAIVHAQLDHILKMLIKTLAGLEADEAIYALRRETSSALRDRVKKLARLRLGEGANLLKLQAWMGRAHDLTERRNDLMHSLMSVPVDGGMPVYYDADQQHRPVPSTDAIQTLVLEMLKLIQEINRERFHGFLAAALKDRPLPKNF